jgi:hypothetical protein
VEISKETMAWGLGVLGIGTCLSLAYRFDVLGVVSPTPVAAQAFVAPAVLAAPVQPVVLPPDPIFLEEPAEVQLVAAEIVAPAATLEAGAVLIPAAVAVSAPVAAATLPAAPAPAPAPAPVPVRPATAAPTPAAWPVQRVTKVAKPSKSAQQTLALVSTAAPQAAPLTMVDSNQPALLAPVLVADPVAAAPATPTIAAAPRPAPASVATTATTPTVLKTVPVYAVPVPTTAKPLATAAPTTAAPVTTATLPPKVTTTTTLVPLPTISAPIVNKSVAAVQTPTRVDVGNAGSVVFSLNSSSALSLVAALPAPGVVALVTSNTPAKLSVKFFSPGVAGSASFNATLAGGTFTYQTGA